LDMVNYIYAAQPDHTIETAQYFDDVQWWGLAWARAYELTQNSTYLTRSQLCWSYVQQNAWDSVCGGGVWWSVDKNYKNAITNELFLTLSSKLFRLTGDATYLNWALEEYDWFMHSGMLNAQWLINDGLTDACVNNNETTWTYNQGVILGGLAELAAAQPNNQSTYLTLANNIATAATTLLVYPNGVLRDVCEPDSCGSDGTQFKGIFVRYLGYLSQGLSRESTAWLAYAKFVQTNAASIWNMDMSTAPPAAATRTLRLRDDSADVAMSGDTNYYCFGVVWEGPFVAPAGPIAQSSALDCFNAMYLFDLTGSSPSP